MKIVVNKAFGGFRIPEKLVKELGWYCVYFKGGESDDDPSYDEHADPELIAALERMIENGEIIGPLKIVEIPDDVNWYIEDYDGIETIHEVHRSWP